MGMTRAWLAAGAGSVLATLWPTPDDHGDLLESFYRQLGASRSESPWAVAEALQQAQREAMTAPGRSARASSWAAYVLTGLE